MRQSPVPSSSAGHVTPDLRRPEHMDVPDPGCQTCGAFSTTTASSRRLMAALTAFARQETPSLR